LSALRRALWGYAFLLPALLILGAFVFYPILFGLPLSLTDYSVIGKTHFVGLANFRRALASHEFWISLKNSLFYLFVVPPIQILSILLAVLVNRNLPGIGFFRAVYYLPVVTSMVAVAITWQWIYGGHGLLNAILLRLGLVSRPIYWNSNTHTALPAVMFITLWKGLGYYMVIYLAGLQAIPKEVIEAARIDGAGSPQVIRWVIVPLLRPYILVCSLLSTIAAVRVFDEVYVIHPNGGPLHATLVSSLYIYREAFLRFDFGYAAAVGLLISVVLLIPSILLFRWGREP
jgi:putative chitobiose transport system permease protein